MPEIVLESRRRVYRLPHIPITLFPPLQRRMLQTVVRVSAEVTGALVAGVLAAEVISPSLHGNDFSDCLDKKSECFVSQSGSLSAEFMDIFHELQTSSMKRLVGMSISSRDPDRKAVAPADIDEFLSNLTNDDPDLNSFPDFFAENVVHEGNIRGMKKQPVLEPYRIIPLAEVAKLNNLFGNTTTGTSNHNNNVSSPSSSSWLRPLTGTSPSSMKSRQVADILTIMWERDRCAIDLFDNFELQQERISRQIELCAAECMTPAVAHGHARASQATHLGLYLAVCMVLDRLWTGTVYSSGGTGGGSTPTTPSGLTVDQAWNEMHQTPSQRIRQAFSSTQPYKGRGLLASMYQRILSTIPSSSSSMQSTSSSPLPSPFSSLTPTKPNLSFFSSHSPMMNDVATHSASPGTGAKSWLASLNGGFSFPSTHRPSLARTLLLYFPLLCICHYLSTSAVGMMVDDDDDEEEEERERSWGTALVGRGGGFGTSLHKGGSSGGGIGIMSGGDRTSNKIGIEPPSTTGSSSGAGFTKTIGNSKNDGSMGSHSKENSSNSSSSNNSNSDGKSNMMSSVWSQLVSIVDSDDPSHDLPAKTPLVWLGATHQDPFTIQRIDMNVVEKPLMDGLLYQGILFLRLLGVAGAPVAMVCTPIVYGSIVTGSAFDLRAMLLELRMEDALAYNLVTGLNVSLAFYLTRRLWCAVLLQSMTTLSLMATEFNSRDDMIGLERLSLWPDLVKALSLIERWEYLQYRMINSWVFPIERWVTRGTEGMGRFLGTPKATPELHQLARNLMQTFSTSARARTSDDSLSIEVVVRPVVPGTPGPSIFNSTGGADLMSSVDMEDLTEALHAAFVTMDNRDNQQLTMFERARRQQYKHYVTALKVKEKLPDTLKVLLPSHNNTVNTKAGVSGSAGVSVNNDRTLAASPSSSSSSSFTPSFASIETPRQRQQHQQQQQQKVQLAKEDLDRMEATLAAIGGTEKPIMRLLFDDTRQLTLQHMYPHGASLAQLEQYLVFVMTDLSSKNFLTNVLNTKKLFRHMTLWEQRLARVTQQPPLDTSSSSTSTKNNNNNSNNNNNNNNSNKLEQDFLDFAQQIYWSILCELLYEAIRFARVQVPLFLDRLAGRKATSSDALQYQTLLTQHFQGAGRRATLMALAPHGLTERRFDRLMQLYGQKYPSVVALKTQWDDYFHGPKYQQLISGIVNPLTAVSPLGIPEPHRQGDMTALLLEAIANDNQTEG